MKKPQIMTATDSYVVRYPQFVELANTQFDDCRWTAEEIAVEKDKQDMLVNVLDGAKHATTTGLKLFTRYEMFAGKEYWLNRVMKAFPRPEIERMAAVFGVFELHVHAPFYNKLNEVLGLDTDEFYTSYVDDPVLNQRVKFLDELVDNEDDLLSVSVFSILEGAILFTLFGYFKSYQSRGNNQLGNVVRGIDQSVVDEGLHATAGAILVRTALDEMEAINDPVEFAAYRASLGEKIRQAALVLYEHEAHIADMLEEKGSVGTGWNAKDSKAFTKSRINICVGELGFPPVFTEEEIGANPIADYFYAGIQKYQLNDFFTGKGREYTSQWIEGEFEWSNED